MRSIDKVSKSKDISTYHTYAPMSGDVDKGGDRGSTRNPSNSAPSVRGAVSDLVETHGYVNTPRAKSQSNAWKVNASQSRDTKDSPAGKEETPCDTYYVDMSPQRNRESTKLEPVTEDIERSKKTATGSGNDSTKNGHKDLPECVKDQHVPNKSKKRIKHNVSFPVNGYSNAVYFK